MENEETIPTTEEVVETPVENTEAPVETPVEEVVE